jgi:hypothetical protein
VATLPREDNQIARDVGRGYLGVPRFGSSTAATKVGAPAPAQATGVTSSASTSVTSRVPIPHTSVRTEPPAKRPAPTTIQPTSAPPPMQPCPRDLASASTAGGSDGGAEGGAGAWRAPLAPQGGRSAAPSQPMCAPPSVQPRPRDLAPASTAGGSDGGAAGGAATQHMPQAPHGGRSARQVRFAVGDVESVPSRCLQS